MPPQTEITGYLDRVKITRFEKGGLVTKQHISFSEVDALYTKEVAATEVEIHEVLSKRWPGITPEVLSYSLKLGVIEMEMIHTPFELLERSLIRTESIPLSFFSNMAYFLNDLAKFNYKPKNPFYTWDDTRKLRTTNIPDQFIAQITNIFDEGRKARHALVLGGLSPKNIFTDRNGNFKLIDFENSLNADYTYDRGFFLGHLMLFGLVYKNQSVEQGIDVFIKSLDLKVKRQIMRYAGVMLLHRSSGWNLKANVTGYEADIIDLGKKLIEW